jgi:hypothetical protein
VPGLAGRQRQLDLKTDPKSRSAIVAIEFAAFPGVLVELTADEPVADSTREIRGRNCVERMA